jgi:lysophospholipase L1-like esterase
MVWADPYRRKHVVATMGLLAAGVLALGASVPHQATGAAVPAVSRSTTAAGWVGSWEAPPATGITQTGYVNYTIRDVIHTSIGGSEVRIRLANTYGTAPVLMGHVTVALPAATGSAAAVPGSVRNVTFNGASTITIPAGAEALSDPVMLTVTADHDLLVSTFTPQPSGPVSYHPLAQQTSFFTTDGDHAGDADATAFTQQTYVWHYLDEVDVLNPAAHGTVVTLGDSITDGYQSTPNVDHRWPDDLARRLQQLPANERLGVLNAGISANRILLDGTTTGGPGAGAGQSALARLDRDVLTRTGVRSVIVLEGINDIQQLPHQTYPAQIIAGLEQIITQAHAAGVRVIGGTILPFEGWTTYDAQEEATRTAVNTWIRTSGAYDGVVDFDAAVRDPADPHRMLPAYDSGDHLHPNDAGYTAMSKAVNLANL